MDVVGRLREFVDGLDRTSFYLYMALLLGSIIALNGLILVYYYYQLSSLDETVFELNEDRRKARKILTTFERVKKHKDEVDKLLSEDPEFKIISYFNGIRTKLGFTNDNIVLLSPLSDVDQGGKYTESSLKVQLTNINMKQLCELLDSIDHDKRIYTKELEIAKSKKNRKILDVSLTIATLELKTAGQHS